MLKRIRNQQGNSVMDIVISLIFFLIFFCLVFGRGVFVNNTKPVEETLKVNGYTEYQIKDKDAWFVGFRGCQVDEAAKFEVTAKNSAGKKVNFLVCTGWPFKGATIRSEW